MKVTDRHVLFYGKDDPFSNFNPSPMTVSLAPGTRPVRLTCGEHLFMCWKAIHFADYDTLAKLVAAQHDPKLHKRLGRGVTPFDEDEWDRVSPRYMFKVLLPKYEQNDGHRAELLKAEGKAFVEASPTDRIWGVGLAADDAGVEDPSRWKGANRLGHLHDMAFALFADREARRAAGLPAANDPRAFYRAEAVPPLRTRVGEETVPTCGP